MATTTFNAFAEWALENDVESATLRVLLFTDDTAYTPDRSDATVDDIVTGSAGGVTEVADASYSRQTLSNVTVSKDDGNSRAVLDADDVDFGNLEGDEDAAGALVFVQVGESDDESNDIPVLYTEFVDGNGDPKTIRLQGSPFTVAWASVGLVTFDVAAPA